MSTAGENGKVLANIKHSTFSARQAIYKYQNSNYSKMKKPYLPYPKSLGNAGLGRKSTGRLIKLQRYYAMPEY